MGFFEMLAIDQNQVDLSAIIHTTICMYVCMHVCMYVCDNNRLHFAATGSDQKYLSGSAGRFDEVEESYPQRGQVTLTGRTYVS